MGKEGCLLDTIMNRWDVGGSGMGKFANLCVLAVWLA